MKTSFSITILLVLAISPVCSSATIEVPKDYPTIQAAIDAAVNGDTVLVAPGIYSEIEVRLTSRIYLQSSHGPEMTVISGDVIFDCGNYTPELIGFTVNSISVGYFYYSIHVTSCIVKGNVFSGWPDGYNSYIGNTVVMGSIKSNNSITIEGCTVFLSLNLSTPHLFHLFANISSSIVPYIIASGAEEYGVAGYVNLNLKNCNNYHISKNQWVNVISQGCISANSKYVKFNDYHLSANSPCIDYLSGSGGLDVEGDPRLNTDIGADEFYEHVYYMDDSLRIIGTPGATTSLYVSLGNTGALNTKWGNWFLQFPVVSVILGPMPTDGYIFLPATPVTFDVYAQALIGNTLTNLCWIMN